MSIIQALLIAVITWLIIGLEAWLAYPMINIPLVICPIVGLIMGDFTTGIMAGATLQLAFMGVMQIGGTLPAEATLGSVMGTAFAIALGQDVEIAMSIAIPVAMVGSTFTFLGYVIRGLFTGLVDKLVAKGNIKGLERLHLALAFLPELPKCIVLFAGLAFGSGLAESIVAAIPQVVVDGLDVATGFMPAVGFALLLGVMWSKKTAIYFLLGVLLSAYLQLPIIAIALVGLVIAVIFGMNDMQNAKTTAAAATVTADAGEEELFND